MCNLISIILNNFQFRQYFGTPNFTLNLNHGLRPWSGQLHVRANTQQTSQYWNCSKMKPTVEYDIWCMRCNNKSFDIQKGILCKITNNKPEFDLVCSEYDYDPFAEQKLMHEDTRYISSNRRILVRSKSYILTAFSIAAILFLIFGKIGLAFFGIFPSILFLFALPRCI